PATLGPAQPDEPAQVSDATPANETVTEEPQELALMNPELPEDPTLTEPDWGLEWPAALPTEISHRLAFAALFDRWHTPYEVGSPVAVCDYALSVGLRCLRRSGNLRSIMALDRPAVLELADDTGARYHAVLLAIDGERADLVIGDREVTATLRELDARWLGDYTILWQMPPGYVSALREGDRGEAVEWLRARLAELSLKAPDPEVRDPAFFDPELAAMLRTFQDANGLMADGVAGTYTWIRLNSMLGLGVPRLTL
ncbi:MAG: peptidoglycan-binding domain-containing protein, partial [Gammaproteobacteria bacterium]